MARMDDGAGDGLDGLDGPGGRGEVEWLDIGPPSAAGASDPPHTVDPLLRRRRRRQGLVAALLVLAGVVAVAVARRHEGTSPLTLPTGAPSSAQPSSTARNVPAPSATATRTPPAVVTRVLGHPLLGVRAGWELFARGPGVVIRIEPARGRVTTTELPLLGSDGPTSFVVGPYGALIRPQDSVEGYLVPDGRPARTLAGAFAQASQILPGPRWGEVWLVGEAGAVRPIRLTRVDDTGQVLQSINPPLSGFVTGSDGAGYLLMSGIGGVYDLRPDGAHRITSGSVLAVGPTRFLLAECDERYHCSRIVVDRTSGARRVIPGSGVEPFAPSGTISPDGRTAAILGSDRDGQQVLRLVDLATGAEQSPQVTVNSDFSEQTLVWSPDGRWLFGVAGQGWLFALDPRTARLQLLDVTLPEMTQLAIRAVPPSR